MIMVRAILVTSIHMSLHLDTDIVLNIVTVALDYAVVITRDGIRRPLSQNIRLKYRSRR